MRGGEVETGMTLMLLALTLAVLVGPALAPPFRPVRDPRLVEIPSFDGTVLHATYFAPDSTGPAVIIFRNCDRDKTSLAAFGR